MVPFVRFDGTFRSLCAARAVHVLFLDAPCVCRPVHLRDVTILSSTSTTGVVGSVHSTQGDVRVTVNSLSGVDINMRQNDNKACLMINATTLIANNATAACDGSATARAYDLDKDGAITTAEFRTTAEDKLNKCCNDQINCLMQVHGSEQYCDAETLSIFGGSNGGNAQLTTSGIMLSHAAFLSRLHAHGDHSFFPDCPQVFKAKSSQKRLLSVSSNQGQVSLVDQAYVASLNKAAATLSPPPPPPPHRPLNLLRKSFKEIRSILAANGNNEAFYLTITTKSCVNLEAQNFVYVSNPVYLDVEPPFLEILGAWVLMPTIKHALADFTLGVGSAGVCSDTVFENTEDIVLDAAGA